MHFYNAFDRNNGKILCPIKFFQFERFLTFWDTLIYTNGWVVTLLYTCNIIEMFLIWVFFSQFDKAKFIFALLILTLSPPTKIESYSLMDVSIFFNFWLFFKLIPLTNPSKVRFLVYYKKNSEIWDQRFLVSLFLG